MKHHDTFGIFLGHDTLCGAEGSHTIHVNDVSCPLCKVILDQLLERDVLIPYKCSDVFYLVFKNGLTESVDFADVVSIFREVQVRVPWPTSAFGFIDHQREARTVRLNWRKAWAEDPSMWT